MKDFDGWNELKKGLAGKKELPEFQVRDVWWCSLGANLGFEEDGKGEDFRRPVLVLRKFNKNMFVGLPLTSRAKDNKFHYKLPKYRNDGRDSYVILSQVKLLSVNRLTRKIYRIEDSVHCGILGRLGELLAEKANPSPVAKDSRIPNGSSCLHYSKVDEKSQELSYREEAKS